MIKKAFQDGLIQNGEIWMNILEDRNMMSHTYNQEESRLVFNRITTEYFDVINLLYEKLKNEISK